jgi:two-component system, NtrC family, response regulator
MIERYVLIADSEDKLRGLMDKIVSEKGYKIREMVDFGPGVAPDITVFDLASVEKSHIQRVLSFTNGNKVEAARLLNIGLTTVYRKIIEYKLE